MRGGRARRGTPRRPRRGPGTCSPPARPPALAAARSLTTILNSTENRSHAARSPRRSPSLLALATRLRGVLRRRRGRRRRSPVAAAFYPLAFVAERVGGRRRATVTNLTQPGRRAARPGARHQGDRRGRGRRPGRASSTASSRPSTTPSTQIAEGDVLDVADVVRPQGLRPRTPARTDPHFWQDPLRMADAGRRGRRRSCRSSTPTTRRRTTPTPPALRRRPRPRSTASTPTGWPGCARDTIVVSPRRVRLPRPVRPDVEAIAGLSPDAEPTPADLARLQELIDDDGHHHRLLRAAGQPASWPRPWPTTWASRTAVLDPIEGLSDETADEDYLSLMRAEPRGPRGGERMPPT